MHAIKQIFDPKSATSWYFISKKLYQYVTRFYESAWVFMSLHGQCFRNNKQWSNVQCYLKKKSLKIWIKLVSLLKRLLHLQVRPAATLRLILLFAVRDVRILQNSQQGIIYTQNSVQTVH